MRKYVVGLLVSGTLLSADVYVSIVGNYEYERTAGAYWHLAVKASTIEQKAEHVDRFVEAVTGMGLGGKHNALFLTTPNNGFDENVAALRSLQGRLHEIRGMDVGSFQYQTAIQQITAQEQGEAKPMLEVIEGCWWKARHPLLWDWIAGMQISALMLAFAACGFSIFFHLMEYR